MNLRQNTVHVLLADDDADDRFFFKEGLTDLSITVILETVEDGEKLLGKLSNIESPPPPDVIFLDINMPLMSGIECLERIRSDKKFDGVPVFMFSTSEHPHDIHESYGKGANLYISKSLFFSAQKEILEKLFSFHWNEYLNKIPIEKFVLRKDILRKDEL